MPDIEPHPVPERTPRGGVSAAVVAHLDDPLTRSGYSVMASSALSAVLGVGFWALAAHAFTPAEIGTSGVLIAAMMTVSSVCQLNLGNALLRFLPQAGDRAGETVMAAYGVASVAALIGGTAFVLIAPEASDAFAFIPETPWLRFAFVAAVVAWGVFALQDAALTALRRASWLPVENSSYGLAKLILLGLAGLVGLSNGLFVSWVLPLLVVIPVMNWLLFRRAIHVHLAAPHAPPETTFARGRLGRFLVTDYIGSVFGQATLTLIPIIVLAVLGDVQAGYFYLPFALITAFDLLFYGVTTSLVAEASRDEPRRGELANLVVRRFLTFQIPAALLIAAAAPLLLRPFGADYVEEGTTLLRLMALASCARAIVFLYAGTCRIEGRSDLVAIVEVVLLVSLVPATKLLAEDHGLGGVGLAWLLCHAAVALAVALPLVRFLRR